MSTTLPTDPAAVGPNPEPGPPGWPDQPKRFGSVTATTSGPTRLVWHHLFLAFVLGAVLPLAGTNAVWSADEGALLYQANAVAEGQGWTFEHPFPAADPDGSWYPIHLASFADDGRYLVLGKHTVLVRLAGAVHSIGGYGAILALSVLAAFVAAAGTARLAGRLDPRAAAPALWLAGVASPLFLSAYVAWAHTLAAALIAWSLVGLTDRWSDRPEPQVGVSGGTAAPVGRADQPTGRTGSPAPPALTGRLRRLPPATEAVAALALGVSCLFRTEATLAAIALTMVMLAAPILGLRPAPSQDRAHAQARAWPPPPADRAERRLTLRRPDPSELVPGTLAGVATVAGFTIDRATSIGRLGPVRPPGDRWGGLVGRVEGFVHTWLRPDFSPAPQHLLLIVAAVSMMAAAVAVRRSTPVDGGPAVALLGVAAGAVLVRFLIEPTALIPGLVVAFPLLFAGLALLRRRDLAAGATPILAGFVVLYWLAVLATQYRYGGGGEWGGRYFALGLPAAVAMASVGLVRAVGALDSSARRRILALGTVAAMLPVAMGILGLRAARVRTEALTDRVAAELVEAGDGAQPVVLTTLDPLGRWAWQDVDGGRWLLVGEDDLAAAGSRLRELGVERLLVVSGQAEDDLERLGEWYAPIDPLPDVEPSDLARVVVPVEQTG